MEHKFEIKDGDLIVTVSHSEEDLAKTSQKAMDKCCEQVSIRGFRKGKAPKDLAMRAVSRDAFNDAFTRKLIDDSFKSYRDDEEVMKEIRNRTLPRTVPAVELGGKGDGSLVLFYYPVKPYVSELSAYKDIDSKVILEEIGDKEINAELSKLALDEAELLPTPEAAQLGDIVNIECKGSINGIDRPELQEKSIDVEIGAHKFVPGFEDQIKGHKEGDVVSFPVMLPSNYPDGLADKEAYFTVKILSVKAKKVPEINDEFATSQSAYEDAESLADLKVKISEKLKEQSQKKYRDRKYSTVIQNVIDNSKFVFDEKRLKAHIVEAQKQNDDEQISKQGLDLQTYLKLIQMDMATYENNVWLNNLAQLKAQAVALAIREAENIADPTAEEYNKTAVDYFGQKDFDFEKVSGDLADRYQKQYPEASTEEAKEFALDNLSPLVNQTKLNQIIDFILANNK